MALSLTIQTDNAAFSDDDYAAEGEADASAACRREVARILREVAGKLENGQESGACMDANGNNVGEWSL